MTAGRIQRARRLRREMTPPEVRLWLRLKGRTTGAPHFRRQHALGPYVLDFFCVAAQLVVEVDGWGHNMGAQPGRDERRDAWLNEQGLLVVRIPPPTSCGTPMKQLTAYFAWPYPAHLPLSRRAGEVARQAESLA